MPEQWLSAVKDTLHASRAERDHTRRMCATLKELVRESTNEFWQRANIVNNVLSASVEKIQREKLHSIQQLTAVLYLSTCLPACLVVLPACLRELSVADCDQRDSRLTSSST